MARVLQVVSQGGDFDAPPTVMGTIVLDANGDMVFDDPTHMEFLDRFFRSSPSGPVDKTDRQVFDLLYDAGGYHNGYVGVVPAPAG